MSELQRLARLLGEAYRSLRETLDVFSDITRGIEEQLRRELLNALYRFPEPRTPSREELEAEIRRLLGLKEGESLGILAGERLDRRSANTESQLRTRPGDTRDSVEAGREKAG
ncbi:hypothetical protein [Hyperthermus butylicus]|uniref:Uncharacterized protein n=1 Tax=Hyperthermus butylicus (strain DSM 5456 / JCM 9403 / PLM1-5) TaxID=415426 RepID=A2BKU4_HYPBU|nr:hypothetical protein [Hyperthermus butylicus]ABM80605.1 hypothetical protein Hbut_0751 [Hyperthermus butylicus DSM 5456]